MKKITYLILMVFLFSCSSPTGKIMGKWYAVTNTSGQDVEVQKGNETMSLEFNKNGNGFITFDAEITPCKWELSGDKISLTSQKVALTVEIIENRLLVILGSGSEPMIYIKENDNMSTDKFKTIIRRNVEKSQYLQRIPKDYYMEK